VCPGLGLLAEAGIRREGAGGCRASAGRRAVACGRRAAARVAPGQVDEEELKKRMMSLGLGGGSKVCW